MLHDFERHVARLEAELAKAADERGAIEPPPRWQRPPVESVRLIPFHETTAVANEVHRVVILDADGETFDLTTTPAYVVAGPHVMGDATSLANIQTVGQATLTYVPSGRTRASHLAVERARTVPDAERGGEAPPEFGIAESLSNKARLLFQRDICDRVLSMLPPRSWPFRTLRHGERASLADRVIEKWGVIDTISRLLIGQDRTLEKDWLTDEARRIGLSVRDAVRKTAPPDVSPAALSKLVDQYEARWAKRRGVERVPVHSTRSMDASRDEAAAAIYEALGALPRTARNRTADRLLEACLVGEESPEILAGRGSLGWDWACAPIGEALEADDQAHFIGLPSDTTLRIAAEGVDVIRDWGRRILARETLFSARAAERI